MGKWYYSQNSRHEERRKKIGAAIGAGIALTILGIILIYPSIIVDSFNKTVGEPVSSQVEEWQAEAQKRAEEYDLQVAKEIHALVNEERARAGFAPLAWDEENANVARDYSKKMYETGQFVHSYYNVCEGGMSGENIFMIEGAPLTAKGTVDSWMDSPGHKANILNRWFDSEGVGVYNGYATQMFCG